MPEFVSARDFNRTENGQTLILVGDRDVAKLNHDSKLIAYGKSCGFPGQAFEVLKGDDIAARIGQGQIDQIESECAAFAERMEKRLSFECAEAGITGRPLMRPSAW